MYHKAVFIYLLFEFDLFGVFAWENELDLKKNCKQIFYTASEIF